MKKILLAIMIPATIVTTQANGEILNCKGSIVNSKNDFEKKIAVYIDVVIPDDNAKEYILTISDKNNRQFKRLLERNPFVKITIIEISKSLDKGNKLQPERYEFIVTKMPDSDNSLVGFVYGFEPWILKVDTWKENKPFTFFQTGSDKLIQGECK